MQTDSSASRTWRLSRSASLNTATVEILSSRQARITRSAISPRLAIRTLRNMRAWSDPTHPIGTTAGLGPGRFCRLRIHWLPHAIRSARDSLELEGKLVGIVAVLERFFLADRSVAQQAQHRLIEGLHAVLRHAFGHRTLNQG